MLPVRGGDAVAREAERRARISGPRRFALVVLGCSLVGRLFDASPHSAYWYTLFVVAVFVLPIWHVSGLGREVWQQRAWLLLSVQAVLTYVPFALFGRAWVGGASGLFGGLALLVVSGRAGWVCYGAVAVLEECLWQAVGLPYSPPLSASAWVLIAYGNQSMTLFGLSRLADLVDELQATREALADAEIMRQRLAAASRLRTEIQSRLRQVSSQVGRVLDSTTPERMRALLHAAGQHAREASAQARLLAHELPSAGPPDYRPSAPPMAPRLARAVTAAVLVLFAAVYLLNSADPPTSRPGLVVAALAVSVAVVALQLHLVRFRDSLHKPRGWRWALGLQAVLSFAMYPVAGAATLVLSTFVVASAMLLIDHWSRWLPLAAIVTSFPVLTLRSPAAQPLTVPQKLTWSLYAAATEAAACLLVYGLARLTQVCVALQEARQRYADAAATQERLRLARDTHDTLGLGLSTIALKTDLAAALADRDPLRARHEAAQALHLTALVANDVTAVASGQIRLDLATELATAQHSLHAAGIEASIRQLPDMDVGLTSASESALAAVLREAVTNVLRHSRARTCTIVLARTAELVTLEVANDGVTPARSSEPGQGLANVSARLRDIDGTLRTLLRDNRFTLTATAQLESPQHRDTPLSRAQA